MTGSNTALRLVVMSCAHGVTVGRHCEACLGEVGADYTGAVERGQVWRRRERPHDAVTILGVVACWRGLMAWGVDYGELEPNPGRPRMRNTLSEARFRDQFWFWGTR